MKTPVLVGIVLLGCWTTSTFSASSDTQHPEWTSSIRGKELEAQYLHQLIDDAKSRGGPLDSAWIARLSELEPLHPETMPALPPQPGKVEPAPSRIENPFSPLEQQIQALEMQLSTSSPHSTDQHAVSSELKAQLQTLYAQRPENQRQRSLDQGGDNCADVTVGTIDYYYADFGTTTGGTNDFSTCGNNSAPDVIYQLSTPQSGLYAFNLCGFNYYDARLELRTGGACPGSVQLACGDDECGLQPYFTYYLTAGTAYYVIVDGDGTSSGQYYLDVYDNSSDTCHVTCPAGAIPECAENEGLVNFGANDCDGGCYNVVWGQVPQYQDLVPGQTVCGRYFAYEDSTHYGYWRDTDWYRFTIAEPCTVRWTAIGEAGTYVRLEAGTCPQDSLAGADGMWCTPVTAQAVLGPGSYDAVVYPTFWQSMPPLTYAATLTISPSDVHVAGQFVAPGSFSGNTCSGNFYCSYRPSQDNTIQVTIPRYATWRFSLCNGPYLWDSFIYLSSTACGTPIAFNDDYCNLLSQLDACLYPGVYYLTVEGYSSTDCDPYTLLVTEVTGACCTGSASDPQCQDGLSSCQCQAVGGTWVENANCGSPQICSTRPPCQDDASYGQLPFLSTEQWNAYRSDQWSSARFFDSYSGVANPITSVRFWAFGADNFEANPCTEQPDYVNIGFWADSSGWPRRTSPVAQYSLSLNGTFVGNYTNGTATYAVYQYDAVLPVPCTQSAGWISVYGLNAGGLPNCALWWLTSPYGAGIIRYHTPNNNWFSGSANLAFCLAGQPACAGTLAPPQNLTCTSIDMAGQRHVTLNWQVSAPGDYEIWSTTSPNNDGDPDGGLDSLWNPEGRLIISNTSGVQTWVDPNPVTALYKNYVVIQTCRPVNDDCGNAVTVTNGLTSFTNMGAVNDGPPAYTCANMGSDVWFSYTAVCTGTVTVNTCTGTNYDSGIEVFGGTCSNLGASLACNDDFCSVQSQVTFAATAGNTYLIRVGGFGGNQGSSELNINCQ